MNASVVIIATQNVTDRTAFLFVRLATNRFYHDFLCLPLLTFDDLSTCCNSTDAGCIIEVEDQQAVVIHLDTDKRYRTVNADAVIAAERAGMHHSRMRLGSRL